MVGHRKMPFLIIPAVLAGFVLFYAYGLRYVLTYQLASSGLEARYFGVIRVLQVPYGEIESVRVLSFRESMSVSKANRLGNRLGGPVVLVQRRTGPLNNVLLTPDAPDTFAAELQRTVRNSADGK